MGPGTKALSGLLLACLLAAAPSARAQVYPVRPIKLVVPFAPKGAADIVGRLLAERLSGIMQQPVTVENMAGRGGTTATQIVARGPADGYTLLYVTNATFVTTPIFVGTPGYDPLSSFAPITLVSMLPMVVAVHPSMSANTFAELLDVIKASPGRYRYATLGRGSQPSLGGELFKSVTQLDIRELAARPPLMPRELLAKGEADLQFDTALVMAFLARQGQARVLAVMGTARVPYLPNVPTTVELGHPELLVYTWSGLVAPAGTPPAIIEEINRAVQSVMSEIETQETFSRHGMTAAGSTAAMFRTLIVAELVRWSRALPLSATEGR